MQGVFDRAAVVEQHFLAFGRTVRGDAAGVLVHRFARTHAVKAHLFDAVDFDDVGAAFIVAGEHAAEHDEVGTGTEGLGDVARRGAAAVGTDEALQTVCGVRALDNGRELWEADASHPSRGAHRAGADANLDDIDAVKDQLLGHLTGHHIAGHNRDVRELVAQLLDEGDEGIGVAVGDIDTDGGDLVASTLLDAAEFFEVRPGDAHRVERR